MILKKISLILLAVFIFVLGGCVKSEAIDIVETTKSNNTNISYLPLEVYYTTSGYAAKVSDNYLVVEEKSLRIIDLNTKKVIKEIEMPNNYTVGYDISGSKVVWSAFSSKEDLGKDPAYNETTNTDIFLYDIETNKTTQITTNEAGQIIPKIWGDYIVWQDNRNDNDKNSNPEWDIYVYNITTGEEKLISKAPGIHTNPNIDNNKVVWEDGRNFKGMKELRWGSNVPDNNTDIYMYDIKTDKEEMVSAEPLQECNPTIYGNYIAWVDRNTKGFAAEIFLYDINRKEKLKITNDKFNQSEPKLFDKYLVWTDERNGISSNDVIVNGKEPNSDIFLYDIEANKEYLITGKEPQILPAISSNYIAYTTSRQIGAEIQVVKYK
jgi:beta propeller repeat protein